MQPTSTTGSRRSPRNSTAGRAPRGGKTPSRTADLTGPRRNSKANSDTGSSRRAQKKAQKKFTGWITWTVFACITVMITGAAAGVYSEYKGQKKQIALKWATLDDLKNQERNGHRRLSELSSKNGRSHLLVNNGYIKPGERVLLYPPSEADKKNANKNKNDLVVRGKDNSTGVWARLKRAWNGFTSPSNVSTGR